METPRIVNKVNDNVSKNFPRKQKKVFGNHSSVTECQTHINLSSSHTM